MKKSGKFLAVAAILMFVAAPVAAEEHLNETDDDEVEEPEMETEDDSENETETEEDDSGIDGTDNSTELTINESKAEEIARDALKMEGWKLEESSVHEDDGYYRFRFNRTGAEGEAEVRVDGSSGEVFELEEEVEKEAEESEEMNQRSVEARISAKKRQIQRFREKIEELQEEIQELRQQGEVSSDSENESETEAEVEIERDGNETEVEAEKEGPGGEAEVEARGPGEAPGNRTARKNRPGFVNNLLSGLFG